jgi:hypothetical protein
MVAAHQMTSMEIEPDADILGRHEHGCIEHPEFKQEVKNGSDARHSN